MLDTKTVRCAALVLRHSRQAPGPALRPTSDADCIDIYEDECLKTRDL